MYSKVEIAQITEWNQLIASNIEIYPIIIDEWALDFLLLFGKYDAVKSANMVVNTSTAAIIESVPKITYAALILEVKCKSNSSINLHTWIVVSSVSKKDSIIYYYSLFGKV